MNKTGFRSAISTLAFLAAVSVGANAADYASVFKIDGGLTGTTWTISASKDSIGKVKLFDVPPEYDDDELTNDSAKLFQLRAGEFKTVKMYGIKPYFIMFYPKFGVCNMTVKFHKGNDVSTAAYINVKKVVIPGISSVKLEVKCSGTSTNFISNPNVDNFEAFDGDPSKPDTPLLFTLK